MNPGTRPNVLAMGGFVLFIALSLAITLVAARRTTNTETFFAAGRNLTATQNGWRWPVTT